MMFDILEVFARAFLGGWLIFMGGNHLVAKRDMLVGYATYKGVPYARLLIPFTGLLLFLAGLSVWSIVPGPIGALAAIVFFVPVTIMIHDFWTVEDEQLKQGEITNFFKNAAILSGLLIVLLA